MKKYLFYISQNYSFAILRPIQEILWQRGDEVQWFFEGSAVNPDFLSTKEKHLTDIPHVMSYQADVVLVPANSVPTFIPGLKVAIFHGFDAGKLDSRGRNDHFKVRGCFDLYCTQGPNTTQPFKRMQKQQQFFNVIETGWSTLDPLFTPQDTTKSATKPVILLCATFSKKLSCAEQLHPIVSRLCQSDQWQWIVQFHPKMDPSVIQLYKQIQNENLTYIETDNVIPLLQQADVMVCDTSSVIPMFLVQNKPVVTFRNIEPGPHLIDIENPEVLQQSIQVALSKPKELMQQIKLYSDQIHPYQDGRSAQRVVIAIDEVLAGKHPVKSKKPLNILRNLKYRKRLKYWSL